ncbi:MAG TPA: efflux RND transporter permease subunit, partial [Thermoanaerobaculia bacterium]|nr:efflux RND transporter permease subunit [Thermoanaerobaculia bacterium]
MIRHAIERPVSTLIGAVTLVVLGTFSLLRLPVSLLPELERPRLEITIPAEGRAREEVLDRLTRPVERRLAALAGVTSVRTWTGDGLLRARVESEWQTDADRLRIEAERLLADLEDPAAGSMTIELATGDAEPIVEVAVLGGSSGSARTAFARRLLVPELARLDGAGRIETVGLTPLHVVVRPRAAALAARGLTPADLVERLRPVGAALPAGRALAGSAVRPVLVREEVASLDALRAVRVGDSFLGDVARVGLEEVEDGTFFRLNGEEGVLVRVFRAPEANAVALAGSVRERVGELAERTRSGPRPRVVSDRSGEVVSALNELGLAALIGIGLGAAVLRLLLGRWRPTLAMMVVVPASLLTSFAGFHLAGASLDVVSLAGLALAAGMLVDSAIVVLESIETARASGDPNPAVTGTREIALPVIASFLTSAVVFLPLIYLQGLARAFFGVQAFAIVVSQAASLLFSLTVTPVLSGNRRSTPAQQDLGRTPGRHTYLWLLDGALSRPGMTVLAGTATAALAVLALAVLPRELVPDAPSKELVVHYRLAPDLSPEAARSLGERVVKQISAGSVLAVQLPESEEETGRIVLSFADSGEAERARKSLSLRLPDVEVWVEPRTSAFVEPIERAGRRLEVVAPPELAGEVRERLSSLREVTGHRNRPTPALLLTWDDTRLALVGADRGRIEEQVKQGLGEQTAGRIRMDGVEPEVLVRASELDPDLLTVNVGAGLAPAREGVNPSPTYGATVVPLRALARVHPGLRPAVLERLDGRPAERLVFEGEIQESLLAGLPVQLEGQALELRRAFSQLRLALALSLLLVFLTVAALYESLRLPLVIMATVPVALGGALGLLAVTGQTLNVLSFLGLILLAGVVVNNAIVLVHLIHDRVSRGEAMDDSI